MNMSLNDWYANREILLIGVTSDVGRALLEKILRSFPKVKVYVILRSRNGLNKDDRIKKIFQTPRYERLRQEDPGAISRVKSFEGNLLYDGLGISKDDYNLLKKVSVVFHAAGPHEAVYEFCQELPELVTVSSISSIFRHKGQIHESLQNEHVPEIPLAMVRVGLVGPAYREPMPGFVEILKGSTAFMVGAGLALGHFENQAEVIPVDLAVNTLVVAAWERSTVKDRKMAVVYNATTLECTWNDLVVKGARANRNFAYPSFGVRGMTSNKTFYWLMVLLLEWFPMFLCDTVIRLFGGKSRFQADYERVRNALRSLESIASRAWPAERNRVYLLQERLNPEDRETFPVTAEIDLESYVLCAAAAVRKHCVDGENIKLVTFFRRLLYLIIASVLAYLFFFKYNKVTKQHAESIKI